MIAGICKFCGCTEEAACQIPVSYLTAEERADFPLPTFPCSWLLEDVCTNPACVQKAYAEACAMVEELIGAAA